MRTYLTKLSWILEFGADACQKRFSWFSHWSPKVQKFVNVVDLVKSFQHRFRYSREQASQSLPKLSQTSEKKLEYTEVAAFAMRPGESPGFSPAAPGLRWSGHVVTGCGKLYKARSRLYRSQISQVNMRWKALAEIYTMHSFALLENHIFSKIKIARILSKIANFFKKNC